MVVAAVTGVLWQTCVSLWYERIFWWVIRWIFVGTPRAVLSVADTVSTFWSWLKLLVWLLEAGSRAALSGIDWIGWASVFLKGQLLVLGDAGLGELDSDDMVPRKFLVVRGEPERPGEWGEYYVLAGGDSADRWVCFSTDATGSEFGFYDVVLRVGAFRLVGGVGAQRAAPGVGSPVVPASAVNWLCVPGRGERWVPPPGAALIHLQEEAAALAAVLPSQGDRGGALVVRAGETSRGGSAPVLPMAAASAMPAPGPAASSSQNQRVPLAAEGLGPLGGDAHDGEVLRATLKTLRDDLEALALGQGRNARDRSRKGRGSGGDGRRKAGRRSDG